MRSLTILGVKIHNISRQEALDFAQKLVIDGKNHQITTINPEFLVVAQKNAEFKNILNNADLSLADGVGLQFGATLQGQKFTDRIPGREFVCDLCELASKNDWRVFFLGAGPGVADKAADKIRKKYPQIKIETCENDPTPEDSKKTIQAVRHSKPQILFVAYGAPTQDLWIAKHKEELGVPVMMGVGGSIDYIAGVVPRVPKILQKTGFEWLYRLISQPWRWRRQLSIPLFLWLIIKEKLTSANKNTIK